MDDGRVEDDWVDDDWMDDGSSLCKDCFVYHLPTSSGRIPNLIKSTVLGMALLIKSLFAYILSLIHDFLFHTTKSQYSALQNIICILVLVVFF